MAERFVLAVLALLVVALGFGATACDPGPRVATTETTIQGEQSTSDNIEADFPKPVSVEIPRIEAKSSLIGLGLNPDETLQVPPVQQPMQAGWYNLGPMPGQPGPAVIVGHVDGGGKQGIFYRLKELKPGDEVLVSREDGNTARFVVRRVEQVPKAEFPTDKVYGETEQAELRLITCGGSFDESARSYRDNVIVYAALE